MFTNQRQIMLITIDWRCRIQSRAYKNNYSPLFTAFLLISMKRASVFITFLPDDRAKAKRTNRSSGFYDSVQPKQWRRFTPPRAVFTLYYHTVAAMARRWARVVSP